MPVSTGLVTGRYAGMGKKLLNLVKTWTGIYGLGFNRDSVVGLLLPILFVLIVGGGLSTLVWLMNR